MSLSLLQRISLFSDNLLSEGSTETDWKRVFTKLPAGIHQLLVTIERPADGASGMAIDDLAIGPCPDFGNISIYFNFLPYTINT